MALWNLHSMWTQLDRCMQLLPAAPDVVVAFVNSTGSQRVDTLVVCSGEGIMQPYQPDDDGTMQPLTAVVDCLCICAQ
jgi:hypothetical protein